MLQLIYPPPFCRHSKVRSYQSLFYGRTAASAAFRHQEIYLRDCHPRYKSLTVYGGIDVSFLSIGESARLPRPELAIELSMIATHLYELYCRMIVHAVCPHFTMIKHTVFE